MNKDDDNVNDDEEEEEKEEEEEEIFTLLDYVHLTFREQPAFLLTVHCTLHLIFISRSLFADILQRSETLL